jgi:hypothetical protein
MVCMGDTNMTQDDTATELTWTKMPGTPVQAPISYGDAHHYEIAHRPGEHSVAHRPPGRHLHVGTYKTEREAKVAAEHHAKTGMAPPGAGQPLHDRPLADRGLTSYRLRGRYGYIMIGARDHEDAMREAARSAPNPDRAALEIWNGDRYVETPLTGP